MEEALFLLTSTLFSMGYPPFPEEVLRDRLTMYEGNANDALYSIIDNPPEAGHADVSAGNVSVPPPVFFLNTLGDNFTMNDSIVKINASSDSRPTTLACHPDRVRNGDCAFYSMALVVLCLYHVPVSSVYASYPSLSDVVAESLAAQIRTDIFQYIEDHWVDISLVSGLAWWETMKLAHYSGIPESEKDEHNDEDWGYTAEATLVAWKAKRDDFYGSYVEMNAVVEMVWARDKIPLVIRQWRMVGRELLDLGTSTIHNNLQSCVVAHVLHSGANDTNQAHWQLMNSGSFIHVEEEETEGRVTRRRKKADLDPEWQPPNKKTKPKIKPDAKKDSSHKKQLARKFVR